MESQSSQRPVRVGVIGTGSLGRHHTRLYRQSAETELVGVFDQDRDTARAVAHEFGTRCFDELDALLAQAEGISVATPTTCHAEVVSELLERGLHVLVEKPLTETVAQAEQLVRLADDRRLILHVGHVERYNPVLECLNKVPGPPRFIEAHRLAAYPPPRPGLHPRGTEVSVVLDLMIHELEIVLHLVNSKPTRVDAVGVPILSQSEDIANARLTFANGTVANLTASRVSAAPMRRIRVFKNSAYLALDYQERKGEVAYLRDGRIVREPVPVRQANALQDELHDFVRCIASRRDGGQGCQPRVTGQHGLEALKLAHRVLAEIKRTSTYGGTVKHNYKSTEL